MITLDTAAALKSLANNISLYRRVLDKFVDGYATCPQTMLAHIEAGEREQAERLAHTVKGLAGSIGSPLLMDHAALLEQSLRSSDVKLEDCVPVAVRFGQLLDETIEACKVTSSSLS